MSSSHVFVYCSSYDRCQDMCTQIQMNAVHPCYSFLPCASLLLFPLLSEALLLGAV